MRYWRNQSKLSIYSCDFDVTNYTGDLLLPCGPRGPGYPLIEEKTKISIVHCTNNYFYNINFLNGPFWLYVLKTT